MFAGVVKGTRRRWGFPTLLTVETKAGEEFAIEVQEADDQLVALDDKITWEGPRFRHEPTNPFAATSAFSWGQVIAVGPECERL